jgi:hypothetical protein
MIDHIHRFTLPAAYAILPAKMNTPEASAQLLAIGLQESLFSARVQIGGPARGFWQFEQGGVVGVRNHPAVSGYLQDALRALQYDGTWGGHDVYVRIANNDTLACVVARLLLWTLPERLPARDQPDEAYRQYLAGWRPGKPHPATWAAHYATAWALLERTA